MTTRMMIRSIVIALSGGILLTGCDGGPAGDGLSPEPDKIGGNETGKNGGGEEIKDDGGNTVAFTEILFGGPDFVTNFGYDRWDTVPRDGAVADSEPDYLNDQGELWVIRSKEDLDTHGVTCRDVLPGVDYAENTLLLFHGATNYGITEIGKSIETDGAGRYVLTANIVHNGTCWCPVWKAGVVVSRLPDDAEVELRVTRGYGYPEE